MRGTTSHTKKYKSRVPFFLEKLGTLLFTGLVLLDLDELAGMTASAGSTCRTCRNDDNDSSLQIMQMD